MIIKEKRYRHKYEPLISKDLYDKVQEVKIGFTKKSFKYAGLPYFYRDLIRCGECGCSITPERSKGYVYYHCTQYKGKHEAPYIREEELTRQLVEAFRAIQPTHEQFAEVIQLLRASHGDKVKYRTRHESSLRAELTRLKGRKERLFDTYLDGMLDKGTYETKSQEIVEAYTTTETKLGSLDKAGEEFYSTIENIMQIVRDAPMTFESSKLDTRRELINLVLQNLTLEDRQLRWKYKKPFDSMASCREMNSWLGWRDSNPRMLVPETSALPLGDTPMCAYLGYHYCFFQSRGVVNCRSYCLFVTFMLK